MVQDLNPQKLSRFLESPGDDHVHRAGFGVATGVVVERDNRIGIIEHGRLEDFAGFDVGAVEAADGDDVESGEFVFGVEGDDAEDFGGGGLEIC